MHIALDTPTHCELGGASERIRDRAAESGLIIDHKAPSDRNRFAINGHFISLRGNRIDIAALFDGIREVTSWLFPCAPAESVAGRGDDQQFLPRPSGGLAGILDLDELYLRPIEPNHL
jgi:hypothetical protein